MQLSFLRPLLADVRGKAWHWLVDANAGGGMLGALGAHFVDSLRWWFGEISEVAGASSVSAPTVRAGGNLLHADAEDTFAMLLRFASGAIGNIICSTTAWHGPGEEIRAFGADGVLTIALDGTLWGARSGDPSPKPIAIPPRLLGSGIPEVDAAPAGHTPPTLYPAGAHMGAGHSHGDQPISLLRPLLSAPCRKRSTPCRARRSNISG